MININQFPEIIESMKKTPQDKEWHAEGNVFIHSQMVLNELQKLEEFQTLTKREQEILSYAAFFHDIGKPYCTKEDNGRIVSKGHSKLGSKVFRETFFDSNLFSFEEREIIANLIKYHGYPPHYYKKRDFEIVSLAEAVNLKYLYLISKADILGRITYNQDELLLDIDFFKEKAIEFQCYESPRKFNSIEHREFFLSKGYDYEPFRQKRSTVTLLVGLPGVGKDYFLRDYVGEVISLDNLRKELGIPHGSKRIGKVIQAAKLKAKQLLAKNENFAWNATNLNKENRLRLISLFKEYNAIVEIVYLEKPLKTIIEQNKNRENSIPESTVFEYLKRLEVPTKEECDIIHYIVNKDKK